MICARLLQNHLTISTVDKSLGMTLVRAEYLKLFLSSIHTEKIFVKIISTTCEKWANEAEFTIVILFKWVWTS